MTLGDIAAFFLSSFFFFLGEWLGEWTAGALWLVARVGLSGSSCWCRSGRAAGRAGKGGVIPLFKNGILMGLNGVLEPGSKQA